jgi:hypothetical protein
VNKTHASVAFAILGTVFAASLAARELRLDSVDGLSLHNVQAEVVKHEGKRGLRVTVSAETRRKIAEAPAEKKLDFQTLALVDGSTFTNGVIEAEISGEPAPDAAEGARGFVGIAFRVQPDRKTYDAFYLRPTNGRADDQVRRNHSVQYISSPDWPWPRLRKEFPEMYESYVDLEAGKWTRVRIEVQGERALLFVHGQSQPTLIVKDLKTGPGGSGAVALWTNSGTIAHFRDLRISGR